MADIEVNSTCEDGYTVESVINGEWELITDALSEDGPSPNEILAADYASCYIPALRVAAGKYNYDDIGQVEIEVAADLDEDDDLESIAFDLTVEESLGEEEQDIVDLAEDICHVHSALVEELHAEIEIESGV
ncbi:OsmC family protein [Haloarcula salinisoli]|uniref:OsmC family protein n=1 Tax=Haloarcula salinisoli TaxID=2487746 RepID=A0A8J7YD64_9EURY|nr:OsmC family protein [Halomicroarcula salinisoli]MBX0303247.1 OsmC family protein [Halomicroarcula salinisoli]